MTEDPLSRLELAFARMEATVTTKLENVIHDARNTRQQLEAFVTRREAAEKNESIDKDHDALRNRVAALESIWSKAAWAIIMSWIAGLGIAVKVFK